jgi:hypothetical protein
LSQRKRIFAWFSTAGTIIRKFCRQRLAVASEDRRIAVDMGEAPVDRGRPMPEAAVWECTTAPHVAGRMRLERMDGNNGPRRAGSFDREA